MCQRSPRRLFRRQPGAQSKGFAGLGKGGQGREKGPEADEGKGKKEPVRIVDEAAVQELKFQLEQLGTRAQLADQLHEAGGPRVPEDTVLEWKQELARLQERLAKVQEGEVVPGEVDEVEMELLDEKEVDEDEYIQGARRWKRTKIFRFRKNQAVFGPGRTNA